MSLGLATGRTPPEPGRELCAPMAHGSPEVQAKQTVPHPLGCWLKGSPTGGIDSCRVGFKYFEVIPILDSRLS